MPRMIAERWRTYGLLKAVLAIVTIICCLLTVTNGYAETTPGGSGRQPNVRPADVPSNSLPYTYIAVPSITSVTPASGPVAGGTTVIIVGINLTGATAVGFGGTPATSFTVNSATQITAVVPAGTGTVQVTVTTPNGTTNSLPYAYVAGPTITSLSPTYGPLEGGTTVIITGLNFTGATSVSFGGNPATSYVVDSATQITAVSPLLSCATSVDPCQVQVTVTTPYGTSNGSAYRYVIQPIIGSIVPASGPVAGGNTVAINGYAFLGATAVSFGGTPATSFTVNSDFQISAVVPAHAAGAVNVTVTALGGTSTTYTYTYVAIPTISGLTPTSGPAAGGTTVTITGPDLLNVTAVSFGGTPATSFTVNSATQITAVSPAGTGTVQVTVTNTGGTSSGTPFTYVPAPTASGVVPTSGPAAGGTSVTITGTNFTGATAVTFAGVAATSFTVDSATQITAVTPAHAAGAVTIAVTTPGGTASLPSAFTYIAAPTVTSVSPPFGDPSGGDSVTVTGTNFTGATAVTFGGVPVTSFVVISATQITAVTPSGTGQVDVAVTTPGGTGSAVAAFDYAIGKLPLAPMDWESDTVYGVANAPLAAPALASLTPAFGPETGGNTVIIAGSGLTGVTSVMFGSIPAASFTVVSDTQITAVAPAGTGTVPVIVRNSAVLAFQVANAAAAEGNSGTTTLTFTVTLSAASGQAATVQYATSSGTATGGAECGVAGVDYQSVSGTLTFNAGETSKSVLVSMCGDTSNEPDETFTLTLSNPTGGATISTASATGTVGDDDTPQSVRVDPPTITYNPDGTATATFPITTSPTTGTSASGSTGTVIRSSSQLGTRTYLPVSVSYSTVDGTGHAGVEYLPTSGTLTFGPGDSSRTVDVTILSAGLASGNNSFLLVLSGPSNATIPPGGGQAQAVVGDVVGSTPAQTAASTDDDDKPRKETEEQRRQRQHTNRGNRDDEYTEGNVVEVHQGDNPPYVIIANRDGDVKVVLQCGSECPRIQVGQYLEADGVKENEALFYAESVTISKK